MLLCTLRPHPKPTVVQASEISTGGFQISSLHSTLCIVLKNTSLHMWAQLPGCPSHAESIRKVIFTLSVFLNKDGKYHKHAQGPVWGRGVVAKRRQMLHVRRQRAVFFLWGELRGALFLFLACKAAVWCVIACSFLRSGTRTFRVSTPDSDSLERPHSQSLWSCKEVKWVRHLKQTTLSVSAYFYTLMTFLLDISACSSWHTSTRF